MDIVGEEAADLQRAHDELVQIARGLHYPAKAPPTPRDLPVTSQMERQAIDTLLADFHPDGTVQWAQRGLHSAFKKRWDQYPLTTVHSLLTRLVDLRLDAPTGFP